MSDPSSLGDRLRTLRASKGLTQAQMAKELGISGSYLNLLEKGQRPVTARILLALAKVFQIDVDAFAGGTGPQLELELKKAFSDPLFGPTGIPASEVRALANLPAAAQASLKLYTLWQQGRPDTPVEARTPEPDSQEIADQPEEAETADPVQQLLGQHQNHFPTLELAAERLRRTLSAVGGWQDLAHALVGHLEAQHGVQVMAATATRDTSYDASTRTLSLPGHLTRREETFALARHVGVLEAGQQIGTLLNGLTGPEHAQVREELSRYFAGATLLPYSSFLEEARTRRYDLQALAARFDCDVQHVAHRLTTLRRPGARGPTMAYAVVELGVGVGRSYLDPDIGAFGDDSLASRWNAYRAFTTPGLIRVQVSQQPGGQRTIGFACTCPATTPSFPPEPASTAVAVECLLQDGEQLIYSDGLDLCFKEAVVDLRQR